MRGKALQLLQPFKIANVLLRNRAVFTAHDTGLQRDGLISDEFVAYQLARTRGGAGLQILTGAAVDETGSTFEFQLRLDTDECISGFRRMAEALHAEGGTVFAQLLHAGRESYGSSDGSLRVTYSSSDAPSERFHIVPRELSRLQIHAIIEAYRRAAGRAMKAGLDGIEIAANQGNLPAQFIAGKINRRRDEYGGDIAGRLRFLFEVCEAVRREIGTAALGVRLSLSDLDNQGIEEDESLAAAEQLQETRLVDFVHVVLGTGSTRAGAYHIVPPMSSAAGYMAPFAQRLKSRITLPVIATGRFNTVQAAESAIVSGSADAIGMTRAMICDPNVIQKAKAEDLDAIRACIGCDQACIGHLQRGYSVSCIQFPESGRELTLGDYTQTVRPRRVLVAGGGPAGLKCAAVAAARGHDVVLCEAAPALGGRANLAAKLDGRAEFGGIITNLTGEALRHGVDIRLRTMVTRQYIVGGGFDAVVVATGARPSCRDDFDLGNVGLVHAEDVLAGASVGQRVIVADGACDWIGIGVALRLVRAGHSVRLAVTGPHAGETIPSYIRDFAAGQLFDAGVDVIPYARFFGASDRTAFFEHVTAMKPILLEGVDTVVASFPPQSNRSVEIEIADLQIEQHLIGDCLTPRTAEEAVLDGLKVGVAL